MQKSHEKSLAVYIDFENLALGFQGRSDRFEIKLVIQRLLQKGKIVAKKAYADWNRFQAYTGALHEAAIELVEIPRRSQTGKNSADIRLCVDAMDLAYSKEHIDTFVVVSGDSDFSPLVSKLKELGKHVIGLGMANSTSNLLRDNCDEFIYYDDLTVEPPVDPHFKTHLPDEKRKAFLLLLNAINALRRENRDILHSSTIKETMRRLKPAFNEVYHGYRSFSAMLEDAQKEGLITIDIDEKSGTYVVTNVGDEFHERKLFQPGDPQDSNGESLERTKRRRRRGGRGRKREGVKENGDTSGEDVASETPPIADKKDQGAHPDPPMANMDSESARLKGDRVETRPVREARTFSHERTGQKRSASPREDLNRRDNQADRDLKENPTSGQVETKDVGPVTESDGKPQGQQETEQKRRSHSYAGRGKNQRNRTPRNRTENQSNRQEDGQKGTTDKPDTAGQMNKIKRDDVS